MTREQQAAMLVVERASKAGLHDPDVLLSRTHALTIIDMLATPGVTDEMRGVVTMPDEPTEEALAAMILGGGWHDSRSVYLALVDHLRKVRG